MNVGRAAVAGLIGTAAMTALLLVEPSIGLPKIAMGQVLSTSLGLTTARLAIGPAVGWGLHFVIGMVLAVIYAAFFERRLPGLPVVRGMIYGVMVFVLAQVVFMPLVGGGVFSRGDLELIAGSLLGHLLYGAVVGWSYRGGLDDELIAHREAAGSDAHRPVHH
jgi:uncharacterized membrane protein YagU involved in acid resistance